MHESAGSWFNYYFFKKASPPRTAKRITEDPHAPLPLLVDGVCLGVYVYDTWIIFPLPTENELSNTNVYAPS